MSIEQEFEEERRARIASMGQSAILREQSLAWINAVAEHRYAYNFAWLGRPIIQFPQDIVAMQELVWSVRPDVIVETGIAHGGSLILSASLLAMLDLADAEAAGTTYDPRQPRRKVVGVDIDIRDHNRAAIEAHPLRHAITMIQGSSVDEAIAEQVRTEVAGKQQVLVVLDSNHTHEHVLRELELYGPLVTPGSYCVVFDTLVEDMPPDSFPDRPWGPGDNPKTAVWAYLEDHPEFEIDRTIPDKLQITVAPDGFLRRKT